MKNVKIDPLMDCFDDEHDEEEDEVEGHLTGVLPIVFGPHPLNPQVVPVLAEPLVPPHLFHDNDYGDHDVDHDYNVEDHDDDRQIFSP